MVLGLFAGIAVRDHDAAVPFYERLLGPADFSPHGKESVWDLAEHRSVYIVEDPGLAGSALVMAMVDDLDAKLAELAARGAEPYRVERYDNGVRKAVFRDADGNELSFGGMPPA